MTLQGAGWWLPLSGKERSPVWQHNGAAELWHFPVSVCKGWLVTVPGREKGELLRGEERRMGSCRDGKEWQVNPLRPARMFGKVQKDPFSKRRDLQSLLYNLALWYFSWKQGWVFLWWFFSLYNRNTRHKELFGHTSLTERKGLWCCCGCNHKLTDSFLLQVTFYRSKPPSFVFVFLCCLNIWGRFCCC